MLNVTDKASTQAPKGWGGMYSADLAGDHLEEYGSVYADTLPEIIKWLKHHKFRYSDDSDLITGTYDGKSCQAIIWYHGDTVGGGKISKEWDKA